MNSNSSCIKSVSKKAYPAVFHKLHRCFSALISCKTLNIAQLLTGRCVEFPPTEGESILLTYNIISLLNLQSAIALAFIAYMAKQLLRHCKIDILYVIDLGILPISSRHSEFGYN